MLRLKQFDIQEKPRKRVKLDIINTEEYDEFKGDILEQYPAQTTQQVRGSEEKCNIENEIKIYEKVFKDIKKNPKAHKKLQQSKAEKKEPKIETKLTEVIIKKQENCTENKDQKGKKKVSKDTKTKKQAPVSSNWKEFLAKQVHNKKSGYQFVAIDCQFVKSGQVQCLARVSLVNEHGDQLYDSYVKPKKKVTDFVTDISGITFSHIKNAPSEETVIPEIKKKMLNKIIIGHTTQKDLQVCGLKDWKGFKKVIDIADCEIYSPGGKRVSLKKLALNNLGKTIQEGWHSSLEDAKITMDLFLKNKQEILREKKLIKK